MLQQQQSFVVIGPRTWLKQSMIPAGQRCSVCSTFSSHPRRRRGCCQKAFVFPFCGVPPLVAVLEDAHARGTHDVRCYDGILQRQYLLEVFLYHCCRITDATTLQYERLEYLAGHYY